MDLVVDLGQSGARVKIGDEIQELNTPKSANESPLDAVKRIFELLPKNEFESVFLSLTGLMGGVDDPNSYGQLCNERFKAQNVYVMDDGFAAYLGALGNRSGVVLTLGGGVVAVSQHEGRFGHADGKGRIFGDFGGGFWLGQMGLKRAIATIDGRDNAADLVALLKNELATHAALENKTNTEAANLCIAAAKTILDGAENGVASAELIVAEGADYLAKTIKSAWLKVSSNNDLTPEIAFLGGLSKNQGYVSQIQGNLSKNLDCNFVQPSGNHLDGAPLAAQLFPNGVDPLLKIWRNAK